MTSLSRASRTRFVSCTARRQAALLLAGASLAALPTIVSAQAVWNGSSSTDWSTDANWTPTGAPTSATDVKIDTTATNPTVLTSTGHANNVTVGENGQGSLTVQANGNLIGASVLVGANAGSNGTVSFSGANAQLNLTSDLSIGLHGSGLFNADSGTNIAVGNISIGSQSDGVGQMTLTGTGTAMNDAADAYIGDHGTGTFYLLAGATLTDATAVIGNTTGSHGSASVDGAGSVWTNTGLTVGDLGTGSLTISHGGLVKDFGTTQVDGANGQVTVTDANSLLNAQGALIVANTGSGAVGVVNGAGLVSGNSIIGDVHNSSGAVMIDGMGSHWSNTNSTTVGSDGAGQITVKNNGTFSTVSMTVGDQADGSGTVWVGASGALTASGMTIGNNGLGQLNLLTGGAIDSDLVTIGNGASANGLVALSGAGSSWTNNGNFVLGSGGTATMGMTTGATLSTQSLDIASISQSHAQLTMDAATLQASNAIGIGESGSATLLVVDGSTLTSGGGFISIGTGSSGSGDITIDGAGSKIGSVGPITIGDNGSGNIQIGHGGLLDGSSDVILGQALLSIGTATVDGSNSDLHSGSHLVVGVIGQSTLAIQNQGRADANSLSVAQQAFGGGILNIQSMGTAAITGNAAIGDGGFGRLNISTGGILTSLNGTLGHLAGSEGDAHIDGAGSAWTTGGLVVGSDGTGVLILSNGGQANASLETDVAQNAGSTGILAIGALATDSAAAPGTITSPNVNLGAGGTLVFNHTDTNYSFGTRILGTGQVDVVSGSTHLTPNDAAFAGTVGINGGALFVDGTLGASAMAVNGGILGGTGIVNAPVTVTSGGIQGSTGNTLTMTNLVLGSGANVNVTLGATNGSGMFNVTQNLTLGGTLNVAATGGFGAGVYRLFDYGGALTDNGLSVGSTPGGSNATDFAVQTGTAHQVNLLYSPSSTSMSYWDGDAAGSTNNSHVDGGDGTWTTTSTNFTDANGLFNMAMTPQPGFVVFQGTPGQVTVDDTGGNVGVTGMQFAVDGYTLKGDPITLTNATIRVGNGNAASANYTATISAKLSGSGGLTKTDFGTLILSGSNDYTGVTTINAGTLQIGDGGMVGSIPGDIIDNAKLVFDNAADPLISGVISGTGSLTVLEHTTLAATNTYTGGTTISSATLGLGTSAAHGSITGPIVDNGSLAIFNSDATTLAGVISGSGLIQQAGTGTTTLTGANHFTGGILISAGTLVGSSSSLGVGPISNNGALVVNQSGAGAMPNAIDGTGTFTKQGTGTLTLTGSSTLTGNAFVAGGTLINNGTLNSAVVTVNSGATLGGNGTFGGSVTVNAGGALNGVYGAGPQIQGDLTLNAGSSTNITLSAQTMAGIFALGGNLTLGGTLNITGTGGFGTGVYRIFQYLGTLTDNGMTIGSVANGTSATDYQLQTATAGEINLLYNGPTPTQPNPPAPPVFKFWDGDGQGNAGNGKIEGGAGTWSAVSTNFTDANGTTVSAQSPQPGEVIFEGTGGAVTVDASKGAIGITGMQFASHGYRLSGDPIVLASDPTEIRVGDGSATGAFYVATIDSKLTGSGRLVKTDLGTLILTADNDYTGGTAIDSGALQIGDGGATGSVLGPITDNSALIVNKSGDTTIGAGIDGVGGLTVMGGGTLTLGGVNSYTGGTTVQGGTLKLTGTIVGAIDMAGGTLDLSAAPGIPTVDGLAGGGAITLGAGGIAIAHGTNEDYSGQISGPGGVTVSGGAQIFSGANSYAGGTVIGAGGTLQIGNGGTGGSVVGAITDNGALIFDRSDDVTFDGAIGGAGTVEKKGVGSLNLTGSSDFGGPTTISGGRLAVNGSLANSAIGVGSGGTLGGNGTTGDVVVHAGGTIAPGNSIGLLHINGNLSMESGSTYAVELTSAGQSDRISVAGTAAIASGTTLKVTKTDAAPYVAGTRYTVLDAAGGVTGKFDLTGDLPVTAFLGLVANSDPTHIYLDVTQTKSFASAAITGNQQAVAHALDGIGGTNPVALATANLMSDAEAQSAFDRLSGEAYASARTALLEDSRFVRDAAIGRLRATADGVDAGPASAVVWGQAYGGWGATAGNGNAARLTRSTQGVIAGGDGIVDGIRIGAMLGYDHGNMDVGARASSARADSYHLGVYAGLQQGPIGVRGGASWSHSTVTMKRTVAFGTLNDAVHGSFHADTTQVFGEAGYRLDLGKASYEPFASLAYANVSSNGVTENGGASALHGGKGSSDATFATVGGRGSWTLPLTATQDVRLHGELAWLHGFGGKNSTVLAFAGSGSFTVEGLPVAKDSARIDLGADTDVARNIRLGLSYQGQHASHVRDDAVKASLTLAF